VREGKRREEEREGAEERKGATASSKPPLWNCLSEIVVSKEGESKSPG
jgi:hypothetical protein